MTYVITEACIGEKNGACVDVCPAACIHTTPDAPQNYIDPDVCIECEQCVLVCPVNAVFLDKDVPAEWQHYIPINADFFRANKAEHELPVEEAVRMVEAVQAYAERVGMAVAAVVLDWTGRPLASISMPGVDASARARADQKAYTSLMYRLGTHQLRPGQKPPSDEVVDAKRVLIELGGLPLVERGVIVATIGVAGSPSPEQDHLGCQAALGALVEGH